jgi:hypothetical protein
MSERREMGHTGIDAAKSAYVDRVLERLNSSLAPSRRKEREERNRTVGRLETRVNVTVHSLESQNLLDRSDEIGCAMEHMISGNTIVSMTGNPFRGF